MQMWIYSLPLKVPIFIQIRKGKPWFFYGRHIMINYNLECTSSSILLFFKQSDFFKHQHSVWIILFSCLFLNTIFYCKYQSTLSSDWIVTFDPDEVQEAKQPPWTYKCSSETVLIYNWKIPHVRKHSGDILINAQSLKTKHNYHSASGSPSYKMRVSMKWFRRFLQTLKF